MKSILITGSTDGIGKLAAISLASEGHTIYIHGRNQKKVITTVEEIKSSTGNEQVRGFVADFSDLNSVKQMAAEVNGQLESLDVLVNNAGVFNSPVSHSKEGYEIRYAVNYLASFVLTNGLLPVLKKGNDARIINLSSAAQSEISFNVMTGKAPVAVNGAYAQSKLALTMWSFYLAAQLENIAVIALNPGSLLNTKMVKEAFGHHWSSADKGANIIAELSVGERYKGITGKYYDNDSGGFGRAHSQAYDPAAISELISFTNNLID